MQYTKRDKVRIQNISSEKESYRTTWRKDYARLIHCPAYRRLQGKTQLFPGHESDFFRNRLTHSHEVAQIAKSIAIRLNYLLRKRGLSYRINTDIVEFAGIAHDIGHPPFGHQGEEALDERMINFGGFEGNAQTLRLLTKLEKKELIPETHYGFSESGEDKRVGLNLAFRTLASILKYDKIIYATKEEREKALAEGKIHKLIPVKGYYGSEKELVESIKNHVLINPNIKGSFKTIECQIMDIADDIAYSTYDLEDAFKAGFIKPIDLITLNDSEVVKEIINKIQLALGKQLSLADIINVTGRVFNNYFGYKKIYSLGEDVVLDDEVLENIHTTSIRYAVAVSDQIAKNGYYRTDFCSQLIGKFIQSVDFSQINEENPCLSKIKMDEDIEMEVETLKQFTYQYQIMSPKLKMVEFRGKQIVSFIFDTLLENPGLMPADFKIIYDFATNETGRRRAICDFIAGMTDKYCVEFYAKLTSENSQTIFKPY
ncbi:dNTP triphosphohydrolase [Rhodocytophaga aerolata]|uniref:Deoxyguanosinetriphosphate triphosphohydrolase-like protein n=1 Tax=Rhodocytophaga aerolata TaxID=455078 RepID=A0ABT8RBS9_9BACT|nr:dNTP triphosphohydrolase [Rhodocytophaga aerolata]MDO1449557.1 dNTP triphosphohydrolase [Rhodocytophaga aerolata]